MAAFARVAAFVRRSAPAVAAVSLSATIVVSVLPQTFGVSHYKRLLANHDRDGKETVISAELQHLIDRVTRRVNLTPEEESRVDFFISFPHNPVHMGSVQMRTGAIVGLPASFVYRTADDLAAVELLVDPRLSQRTVDWTSEHGQSLLGSLVLSDKAKAFVIARELNYIKTYDIHVDVGLRCLFGVLAYTTGAMLNTSLQLTQRLKPWSRCAVFSFVGVAWLLMYVQVSDAISCWRDNRADRKAARLTRAYAEGGVEYYESVLQRNKVLRTLLGTVEGPKRYTLFGNEISTIRNPQVQLTARRDNLFTYLKEYNVIDSENAQQPTEDTSIKT